MEEDTKNDEEFIEGGEAEGRTIIDKRRDASVTLKKRGMRIIKLQAAESIDEVNIYIAIVPNTKDAVFQVVRRYVVCGATFQMRSNLIRESYNVLANPSLWDCGDHLVVSYVPVKCAANFQSTLGII